MNPSKAGLAFLFFILMVASFLEVGSFDSHLANAIADDHPVVWARIFSQPEFNRKDPQFQVAAGFIYSSLPNLITSYSALINERLPEWICYFFLAIQTFGLVLALFVFCKVFIKDPFQALLTAALTFFIHPWAFNLAYYPNLIFTPYPGQLVLPFIVMGAAELLKNRMARSCLWLSLAGLVHPALTLQFLVIAFFYLLFTQSLKTHSKSFLLLGIPAFFALLLPLWIMPKPVESLSKAEVLPSLLNHPHAFPWRTPIFWPWAVPSFLGILILTGLSLKKDILKTRFFNASLLAFVLLGAFHFLSGTFLFFEGAVFSGLRVTTLLSLLLLPFGVQYLLQLLSSENAVTQAWSAFILGFLLISQRGLPWMGLLAVFLLEKTPPLRDSAKFAKGLLFTWWIAFLISLRPLRALDLEALGSTIRYVLAPGFSFSTSKYLLLLAICLMLLWIDKKYKPLITKVALILLVGFGLWSSVETGASSREPKKMALLDVQNWARTQTPRNSAFTTTQWSWQGKSERAGGLVYKPPFGIRNPYFRFGQKENPQNKSLEELFRKESAETIGDLNDRALRELSEITRSQFLVMDKDKERKTIHLPVCFENTHYRVYDLSHPRCSVGRKS